MCKHTKLGVRAHLKKCVQHTHSGVPCTPTLVCFRWVCLARHIWCVYGDMLSTLYTVC